MRQLPVNLHNGQNELLWLVQCSQNFILCDCHTGRAFGPAFDLNEAERGSVRVLQLGGDFGLDVIPPVLCAHVSGSKVKGSLYVHHRFHGSQFNPAPRCRISTEQRRTAHQLIQQTPWDNHRAAYNHRRQGGDVLLLLQFGQPLLHPGL